jgi:hypothetical protein
MKKIMTFIGLAGILCLTPYCKKSSVKPQEPANSTAQQQQQQIQETAQLYVLLDSKPCSAPQKEFTSATVDIRGIKIKNSVSGWEDLTPVPGAWDVVSLQQAPVPVADITEKSTVHTGTITQIALTIGDNNHLVVNNSPARCYNISTKEIVLDMQGVITAGTLNEIVVSIDICGNISIQTKYDQEPCYTLKPVMAFEHFSQINQ